MNSPSSGQHTAHYSPVIIAPFVAWGRRGSLPLFFWSGGREAANYQIQSREHDPMIARWDHLVWIKPLDDTRSIYRDTIDIDAGSLTYFPTLSPPDEKTNSRHSMGELLYASVAVGPAEPALHSIRRCARASSDGGTSSPSAFAVLRLITNSNFVGCSTGKSPGLAPLKIL